MKGFVSIKSFFIQGYYSFCYSHCGAIFYVWISWDSRYLLCRTM